MMIETPTLDIGPSTRGPAQVDAGSGESIAIVTASPVVVSILADGIDAYALNRRTISRLDIKPYLERKGLVKLNLELFFVPSLIDEWSQFDDGYLQQLVHALTDGKHFDRVINIGQAVPLYRRFRPDFYNDNPAIIQAAVAFANTLSALATLARVLENRVLEPKNLDRASYSFNATQTGEMSVVDMEVKPEWISEDDKIWANAEQIGLSDISRLGIPIASQRAAGQHTVLGPWINHLRMNTLNSRFIYSDFKVDYDDQVERIWEADKRLPEGLKLLTDVDGVRAISDQKLEAHGLSADEINHQDIVEAFEGLHEALGAEGDLRMIDLGTILNLNEFGAKKDNKAYKKDALTLLKKFPYTVAFQKMWDRQSKLYADDELNRKVNAWHVANTLLHAKRKLGDDIPPFTVWAIPVMPTNSVRFILDPQKHRANIENTLVKSLSALAQQQLVA